MHAIAKVKEKLAPYPHIRYSETSRSIEVQPKDESGFAVGLHINANGFTVHFDGWHEEFTSEDEAASCFVFGLSDVCRLAVTYRGSIPTRWVVEARQGDAWMPDSETGVLLFPFWRRKRVVYRRNHVLPGT